MAEAGALPLAGIRIVDLGRVIAAPYATQILADLGAEVIKVEALTGDQMRSQGTQLIGADGLPTGLTPHFLSANRNKKSLALDISSKAGQEVIRDLVANADVFVENFKVGNLARFGLDYPSLAAFRPGLIYCSITGFGQFGPLAARPATDGVFQALSGMMSITGERDGPPAKIGLVITDIITGIYASTAILAALRQREVVGGGGRHIDLSLLDVAVATMSHQAVHYLTTAEVPRADGSAAAGSAPAQAFALADGYMLIQAAGNASFQALCRILAREDLLADPDYSTPLQRYNARDRLIPTLAAQLASWKTAELQALLDAAGIIAAPVLHLDQTFAHPQVIARGVAQDGPESDEIRYRLVANPLEPSGMTRAQNIMPPRLNTDGLAILRDLLGYDQNRLTELAGSGAILPLGNDSGAEQVAN